MQLVDMVIQSNLKISLTICNVYYKLLTLYLMLTCNLRPYKLQIPHTPGVAAPAWVRMKRKKNQESGCFPRQMYILVPVAQVKW